MKTKSIIMALLILLGYGMKSDKPAYQFFDSNGKKTTYKKVLKSALDADIIFFGELHNNPICHWLQLELTNDIFGEKGRMLMLGAEMFETDNQLLINEYLTGLVSEKSFEQEARLWPNYETDYKPLLTFAKDNNLNFIATNIPRRYASVVFRNGFEKLDSLSNEAKQYIAPLPVKYDPELKNYKAMLEMMGGGGMGHSNDNLPKAQAIKDATMAHFILENMNEGTVFIHFNGAYHSKDFEGIIWYIAQKKPGLNILTISSEEQANLDSLYTEYENTASYILVTPENMTKTH